mmetsp:Transcript_23067/g.47424  ORF Transcript_23067/g.47424 Transcript_23067/m.47424 type:complete len:320 (+) Transcript_23067:54-1013(+)
MPASPHLSRCLHFLHRHYSYFHPIVLLGSHITDSLLGIIPIAALLLNVNGFLTTINAKMSLKSHHYHVCHGRPKIISRMIPTSVKQRNITPRQSFVKKSNTKRTFPKNRNNSNNNNNARSRTERGEMSLSRSRSRPQDRDTFDDSRSVDNRSLGGASIYNDSKSRSGGKFGGKYEGDLNPRGERHGYGVFVADNGNEYEGEWKNDKRDGHGKAKYNTGDVYIGNWKNCKRHGHGTMYIENGDVYEGNWNNGFKDGAGTYRWRDGELDISRYSSDYRVGEGVRWSEDRRRAFRLIRGNVQEEISLREAERIADALGLPAP